MRDFLLKKWSNSARKPNLSVSLESALKDSNKFSPNKMKVSSVGSTAVHAARTEDTERPLELATDIN